MAKRVIKAAALFVFSLLMLYAWPLNAHAASQGETVTGSFDAVQGRDVATIRYYTNAERSEYAFADFAYNENTGKYEYSFKAPYDGFTVSQAMENVRETYGGTATIIAEYFNVARWDGAVDVSWYDEESAEFYLDTPAKLAGLAAIVNGVTDATDNRTKDYHIKGNQDYIESKIAEGANLPGSATGTARQGLAKHDFSNRTIHLTADLDMGGSGGSEINHVWPVFDNGQMVDGFNTSDYPNWLPIGCEVAADPADEKTLVLSSFNGMLDGGGHNIINLYCYRYTYAGWSYSQGTALVGCIGVLYDDEENPANAPGIKNLSLSGYVYGRRMVGGIAGVVGGGQSAVHGDSVGGSIVFENLANHAYVYSTDSKGIGGIAGSSYVDSGSIINCYNDANITTIYSAPAGGIVGANEHMDIFACYNSGRIDTGTNHYGRGIGGTGNSPGEFKVDSCFYLKGSGDDPEYPGYYQYNLPESVSINVIEFTASQKTDGTLLNGLNVNGTAYVADDDGTPVLYWEKSRGTGSLTVEKPEGGTVEAERTGEMANGTVIYLSNTPDTGWNFRYYTLNGSRMTGDYVTVNGESTVSAFYESAKAGVLQIEPNAACNIEVKKNGIIIVDGQAQQVSSYPVNAGDSLYEGDRLMVTVTLKDGVVPEDPSRDYSAAVGLPDQYLYRYTYTGEEVILKSQPVFDVDEHINADDVSLTLAVVPLTTPKLWKNTPDTTWFDGAHDVYTLTTAAQLAGLDAMIEDEEADETFEGITIRLGNDISLRNTDGTTGIRSWDGIGNADRAFAGTFDGQGHSVTDFYGIKAGLFANCEGVSSADKAVVKNVSVYGDATGQNASGIVSQANNTDIIGCNSYVVISDCSGYSAGILGQDTGTNGSATTVSNCVNYGSITGTGRIGGIVGKLTAVGNVSDCVNKGDLEAPSTNANQVGGVVGDLYGAMTRCANYGDILGYGRNLGGIAGQATIVTAVMTDSYNVGSIAYQEGTNALDAAGGLIGFGSVYQLHNCYNYGSVESYEGANTTHIGSVIGRHVVNSKSEIDNVYVLDSAHVAGKLIDGKVLDQLHADSSAFYATLYEKSAADFAASNGVLTLINKNNSFALTNDVYPEIQLAASTHVHVGGTATCVDRAVCSECGLEYSEVDPDNHKETEIRNIKDPVWVYDGNTGDTYCAACDALISEGDSIPADTTRQAITFVIKQEGQDDIERAYTVAEFDALKTTSPPIAYQFGFESPVTIVASTEYVTVFDVLRDLQVEDLMVENVKVMCDGMAPFDVTSDTYKNCRWYYDEEGNKYSAPMAIGISYASSSGSLEQVAAIAKPSNDLRFGYGVSDEQFNNKEAVGGARCISPVRRVEITMQASQGKHILVEDYTAGSSDKTNKTLKVNNTLIEQDQTFSGETEITADFDKACVVALDNGDNTYTRLYGVEEDGKVKFRVNVSDTDVKVVIAIKGDANLSGSLTTIDGTLTKRAVVGLYETTPLTALTMDVNAKDGITTIDGTLTARIVVDKYTATWDKD